MKLSKIMISLILIILMLASGCKEKSENIVGKDNQNPKKETIELVAEDLLESDQVKPTNIREKNLDPFFKKFPSELTADQIGIYIRENIANASEDEADEMIEWLLIYQNKIKEEFIYKMETNEYINAFKDDMGGNFEKSKVENIQDELIRDDYICLINSFLTIEEYYEYYVIESNWNDLIQYSSYLSDDFRKIVELNKKISNYEYDRYQLDVAGISKDIIIVEEILKNSNSTFIKWKAEDLYRYLVFDLLLGPENTYIYHYQEKNSKEYLSLMEIRREYPGSLLAQIIDEIDQIEVEDIMEVFDVIDKKIQFGINSDNYFEKTNIENQNGEYELIEIRIPSDIEKEKRINEIIKLSTEEYIKSVIGDRDFSLEIEAYSGNNRYIFYSGSANTTDSKGEFEYLSFYRALDYLEEKHITIDEYLDVDFKFIQDFVEDLSGLRIEAMPEFSVDNTGINLYLKEAVDMEEKIFLKDFQLLEYFTLEELIGPK